MCHLCFETQQYLVLPPECRTQQVLNGCCTPETPILFANVQMDEFVFSSGMTASVTCISHPPHCMSFKALQEMPHEA